MFENVDGRTDDGRTDDGVIGILIAHLGAFGSGELKSSENDQLNFQSFFFFFFFQFFFSEFFFFLEYLQKQ